jgi:hypothetical protein
MTLNSDLEEWLISLQRRVQHCNKAIDRILVTYLESLNTLCAVRVRVLLQCISTRRQMRQRQVQD